MAQRVGSVVLFGGPRDGLVVSVPTLPGLVISIPSISADMQITEHRYVVKEGVVLADQTFASHATAVYLGAGKRSTNGPGRGHDDR